MRQVTKKRGPWEVNAAVRVKSRIRELTITVDPHGITYRPKGTRTGYFIPHSSAYLFGAKMKADADRKAKAEARKARRELKRKGLA